MSERAYSTKLGGPIALSVLGHATLVTLLVFFARPGKPPVLPPIYRVDLVAAPPGPRAVGVVQPEPAAPKAPETPAAVPKRAETRAADMAPPPTKSRKAPPKKQTSRATPTLETKAAPKNAQAPVAGGGPEGGKGTDVANVHTEGVDFPYPAYLNNIVRQIRLNFSPRNAGALRCDVFFIINRDGSVDMNKFRYVTRSGSGAFDLEARGAVEAASRSFGRLPDDFNNDFLSVVFSFDPSIIR